MTLLGEQAREALVQKEINDQEERERKDRERVLRNKQRIEEQTTRTKETLASEVLTAVAAGKSELYLLRLYKPGYRASPRLIHHPRGKRSRTRKPRWIKPRISFHKPYRDLIDFIRENGLIPTAYVSGNEHRFDAYYLGVQISKDPHPDLGKGYLLPISGMIKAGREERIVPLPSPPQERP